MSLNDRIRALQECDVVALGRQLLIACREGRAELIALEEDDESWAMLGKVRGECRRLFSDHASELFDAADLEDLLRVIEPLRARAGDGPAARAAVQALDEVYHERFAGCFSGKIIALESRTAFPVAAAHLPTGASARPESLRIVSDRIPHLGLMPDASSPVRVDLDFTSDHALAPLGYGTRAAICVPNETLADFTWDDIAGARPRFFFVRPKDAERQEARLFEILGKADHQKARLVVFPELTMGSPGVVDRIETWLKNKAKSVRVIVAGSYHREAEGGVRRNECVLLTHAGARRVHYKFVPFELRSSDGSDVIEDLRPIDRKLTLHFTGTWSLVTMVCKDLLPPEVASILAELRPRLVVVPSMSPKLQPFHARVASLVTDTQAFVLVANMPVEGGACAVVGRPSRRKYIEFLSARVAAPTVRMLDLVI